MASVVEKELEVYIEYGDLKADFSGNFNEVWRLLNSFLNKVAEVVAKTTPIKAEKMSIPEVVISLRDTGWFDVPRDSEVIYEELKMKGVSGVEPRPTMMALLRLVRKGQMKRFKKEQKYYYTAPWVEVSQTS